MANQITFGATITPATAAMEVSINGGTSFTALPYATVGSAQQGTLGNVPAAVYAVGQLIQGAVGYAATRLANTVAVTVLAAVYDTTITILAGGAALAANGVSLSGPVGSKVEFNRVASTGALPVHLNLLVGSTIVAGLDFESSYVGGRFRFTTPAGTVYSGTANTFQSAASGLTLS